MAGDGKQGVDRMLRVARERIARLAPEDAWAASEAGDALIVDLRSSDERRRGGVVPGSVHVPRSVLEWRADPASAWHNPQLGDPDRLLLLLCAEGYSSSLAAASLVDLGRARSGDVVGGFAAWRAAGLPVVPAPAVPDGAMPGMEGPDVARLPGELEDGTID